MKRQFSSIETLRIIAALMVVFAHLSGFDVPILKFFLSDTFFLGSIGVDIFFVISGFVMYLGAHHADPGRQGGGRLFWFPDFFE